jgi:hypothetical protein
MYDVFLRDVPDCPDNSSATRGAEDPDGTAQSRPAVAKKTPITALVTIQFRDMADSSATLDDSQVVSHLPGG